MYNACRGIQIETTTINIGNNYGVELKEATLITLLVRKSSVRAWEGRAPQESMKFKRTPASEGQSLEHELFLPLMCAT